MRIEAFTHEHIEDAANLVLQAYRAECAAVPSLPQMEGTAQHFREQLTLLAERGVGGVAAVQGGELAGFLTGWPVEHFFSTRSGVYVPLYAHGAAGDRRRVYQALYAEASARWVAEKRLMHVITLFAHDTQAVDTWFWNGFGLRCVDAVRDLSPVEATTTAEIEVRKATIEDAALLESLHREHHLYYRQAPLFMPGVGLEESLAAWLTEENDRHVWLALQGDKPVSYMMVHHGGETFVSDSADMLNICGAYTAPDARGLGAATMLLNGIAAWMRERGYRRLGVDFESFNLNGSRFWNRHFTPFTYSLVRAIDDRIVD